MRRLKIYLLWWYWILKLIIYNYGFLKLIYNCEIYLLFVIFDNDLYVFCYYFVLFDFGFEVIKYIK